MQGLLSLQATIEVVPFEQSTGVPVQGIQIKPSQSRMVCWSLIVKMFPSLQGVVVFGPRSQLVGTPTQAVQVSPVIKETIIESKALHGSLSSQATFVRYTGWQGLHKLERSKSF